MTMHYINRKGQIYYLYQGTTKTGRQKYYFSTKENQDRLNNIPDGFEVYENPISAQVFLIKSEEPLISELEKNAVISSLKENSNLDHFIVDVRKNYITIYTAENAMDTDNYPEYMHEKILRNMHMFLRYMAEMRFGLVDTNKRYFVAERFCYRGSVDDWVTISSPNRLNELIAQFVMHLGRKSFYELFPY